MDLRKTVISTDVTGIAFGFYTAEEIRKMSVKSLTNPGSFDTLGNTIEGGLNDPAMGPSDKNASCKTCSLTYMECPGHLGHIELVSPVYNPLLFKTLYRLLRAKCFTCHHFKISRERLERYRKKLKLLQSEQPFLAFTAEQKWLRRQAKEARRQQELRKGGKDEASKDDRSEESEQQDSDDEDKTSADTKDFWRYKSVHVNQLIRETTSELLSEMTSIKKCENCASLSVALRKEKGTKIFHSKREKSKSDGTDDVEKDMGLVSDSDKEDEDDEGEDVAEGSEAETPKKKSKSKTKSKSPKRRESDAEGSDKNTEEEPSGKKGKKRKTTKQPKLTGADARKVMTPADAQSHMEKLWERELPFLSLIWSSIHTDAASPATKQPPSAQMFFFHLIPVTPPRFRPTSEQAAEHPQSVHYSKILSLTQSMRALGEDRPEGDEDARPVATVNTWEELQIAVNFLVDNKDAPVGTKIAAGVTQILEKKEGMFRKHMMGKRVNFAARSVISPDVSLETNQIGVPLYFAQTLTYPEPVTSFNYVELRDAVIRGPKQHPGANAIEDEMGNKISLTNSDLQTRIALSKTLRVSAPGEPQKKVLRHLKDGDVLLVNRQPTLHKPGIMGHLVKVLQHEKTIRMHYANCATYNADFDGDEMNLHFPQNTLARSEAYNIVLTDEQYLGPKNGQPLRGLIQDHIVTGALLTKRDTFFTKPQFEQLIYGSCLGLILDRSLVFPPPCILKPQRLWTGKQAVSMLFAMVLHGRVPLNLDHPSKIPEKMWGVGSDEGVVVIRDNDLVSGVLDKNHFGASPYGLVHGCFELYGPKQAGQMLSYLGRMFTHFLQMRGFTCGIDDMLLSGKAELARLEAAKESWALGDKVASELTGKKEPSEVRAVISQMVHDPVDQGRLDGAMKGGNSKIQSGVIATCIPDGQFKAFPANSLSLMTVSGAKGAGVNHSQISCLLGQQELEGKRPAPMISGKTLPCFDAYDTSARAGGFVMDRFLTGLRPQEYFFHAMAGREGLIDTAVKTSRSGYLQRCLIKGLEGLRVHYDHTVRDSDGSVVQFAYGGDHLDVSRTQFLMKFPFLASNINAVMDRHKPDAVFAKTGELNPAAIEWAKIVAADPALDPVIASFGPEHVGAVSEKFEKELNDFVAANKSTLFSSKAHRRISREKFRMLMYLKYQQSIAPPGDPVGLLAAQSIGEPSTQMTLNTFHQAGRGEANVTLGIPRMREVLMTAGDSIKTPIMTLPLHKGRTEAQARGLMKRLHRLVLPDVYNEIRVSDAIAGIGHNDTQILRSYNIEMEFRPEAFEELDLEWDELKSAVEDRFLAKLCSRIYRLLKGKPITVVRGGDETTEDGATMPKSGAASEADDNDEGDGESAAGGGDSGSKRKAAADDDGTLAAGAYEKKREKATYDEADEEEKAMSKRSGAKIQESDIEGSATEAVAEQKEAQRPRMDKRKLKDQFQMIHDYSFDEGNNLLRLELRLPASGRKVLMIDVIEEEAEEFVIRCIPRISRSFLRPASKDKPDEWVITTEGVNFLGIWRYPDLIDINKIVTNDLATVLHIYGVEAMRAALINEIQSVFAVYGVNVDRRHLDLIGDFMSYEGKCRPFNRMGINGSTSPLLKMSFETTMQFMQDACLRGDYDMMQSPAARIVLGQPVYGGTGCIDMLFPLAAQSEPMQS